MSQSYEVIFHNNQQWLRDKKEMNPEFFRELADGQNPDYLYIGCSDSRVTAEEMMGFGPGDVFVHRNVANIINGMDLNASSAIEYAVSHLKVKHIIVCGHYGCGGIKAAMLPEDYGSLTPWLRNVRDVYRLHQEELDAIDDKQRRYDRLVELNVQEQCLNVIKMSCVQERYLLDGYPIVHGWVFDLHSGQLIDLDIDFKAILADIKKIYDLTASEWVVNARKKG